MANNFGMPQTNKFMLNEASLLLGPPGSHMDLTVEDHSVGLFKNLLVSMNVLLPHYQPGFVRILLKIPRPPITGLLLVTVMNITRALYCTH